MVQYLLENDENDGEEIRCHRNALQGEVYLLKKSLKEKENHVNELQQQLELMKKESEKTENNENTVEKMEAMEKSDTGIHDIKNFFDFFNE